MAVTYRTAGAWGPGKGGNLTAAEVDTNFYSLVQDIAQVADDLVPAEIENITLVGSQLTFVLSDSRTLGPYTVPTAAFRWAGVWTPETAYLANDFLETGQGVFLVVQNHTSAATFDPARVIGGDPVYVLVFSSQTAQAFTDLSDVPTAYTGAANKLVAVNSAANGLEFVEAPSGSFDGLTDTPSTYTGAAGKLVAVNSSEDGLEFVEAPSGGGLVIIAVLDSTGDLPVSGSPGDAYAIGGDLWVWDSVLDDWANAGSFQGPQGEPGEQGPPGETGATGEQGPAGPIATVDLKAENTASYTVQESDLAGNVIRRMNSASALTVTIPPGLTGAEPFTIIRKGDGAVTFVAASGVTINAAGGLSIARRYASAIVIRESMDNYLLIGDLA
jgi:hypothetical protein